MPTLVGCFHYRNIDVSTVKELHRRFGGGGEIFVAAGDKKHRAIDDLHDSISELRFYLDRMGWL